MRRAYETQPAVRERILQISEQLFLSRGFRHTGIAEISSACEMSPANIYRFFESKAEIGEAVTSRFLARMEGMAEEILAQPISAGERLRELLTTLHRVTCEQLVVEHRAHEMVRRAMTEQWDAIETHNARLRDGYVRLVADGIKRGEFAAGDAATLGTVVFNAAFPFCHPQVVAQRFAEDGGAQARMTADFLVQALSAGVRQKASALA
jgi:Bacterial regulatory proteins, tetR family.